MSDKKAKSMVCLYEQTFFAWKKVKAGILRTCVCETVFCKNNCKEMLGHINIQSGLKMGQKSVLYYCNNKYAFV